MAFVYILYSKNSDTFYIGSCKELNYRLRQHQKKEFLDSFTAKKNDWELFFSISDLDYSQARKMETHIKNMKSKTYIQNLNKYNEIATKLAEK